MRESAAVFGSAGSLVGIVSEPSDGPGRAGLPGVIFLNSGVIHRVGPNRMYVRMARDLARQGFVAFRFDLSGVGDSPARGAGSTIEGRWVDETREAMDHLHRTRELERFVLIGNCSGAGVSFLTAQRDRRVVGAGLINPMGPRLLRYWIRLARNPKSWRRAIYGLVKIRYVKIALQPILDRVANRPRPEETKAEPIEILSEIRSLVRRGTRFLIVYCEWDPGLDYFRVHVRERLRDLEVEGGLRTEIIPGMNHDFSLWAGQEDLRRIVRDWARHVTAG